MSLSPYHSLLYSLFVFLYSILLANYAASMLFDTFCIYPPSSFPPPNSDIIYMETSAKTALNVRNLFVEIGE